jgi:VanZ family protein
VWARHAGGMGGQKAKVDTATHVRIIIMTLIHLRTFLQRLHATVCIGLLAFVSWALLSPMPFATLRHTPLSVLRTVSDVLLHCGAYGLLSFVCGLAVTDKRNAGARRILLALLIAHGLFSELLQTIVPNRSGDALDGIANMIGIAIGAIAVAWARPMIQYARVVMSSTAASDPMSLEI